MRSAVVVASIVMMASIEVMESVAVVRNAVDVICVLVAATD